MPDAPSSRPAGGVEGSEVARLRAENAIMRAALEGQDVHAGGVEDRELVERVMDAIQGVGLSRANRRKVANAAVAVLREAGSAGDSEVERLRAENGIMRAALEGEGSAGEADLPQGPSEVASQGPAHNFGGEDLRPDEVEAALGWLRSMGDVFPNRVPVLLDHIAALTGSCDHEWRVIGAGRDQVYVLRCKLCRREIREGEAATALDAQRDPQEPHQGLLDAVERLNETIDRLRLENETLRRLSDLAPDQIRDLLSQRDPSQLLAEALTKDEDKLRAARALGGVDD